MTFSIFVVNVMCFLQISLLRVLLKEVASLPRVAAFVRDESIQYFIVVEQTVLCQVRSLQYALFLAFSSYYVFHLEYPKPIKNVMFFFQDYILSYPNSLRRPATYLATASDIKKLAIAHS